MIRLTPAFHLKFTFFKTRFIWLLPLVWLASSCSEKFTQTGNASYYSDKLRGNKMANGAKYRPYKRTAAHKTLPFGTKVKVTNVNTGESVKVTITDRGPYAKGRVIDLSRKAAKKIDMIQDGVVPVKIKVVKPVKAK
jgi:rare lipoprotein A